MPICPRCGKILCNDQALRYHLNKKVPCNSLKCSLCNKVHSSKFDLFICEKECTRKNALKAPSHEKSPPNAKRTQTSPDFLKITHEKSPPNAKRTQTSPQNLESIQSKENVTLKNKFRLYNLKSFMETINIHDENCIVQKSSLHDKFLHDFYMISVPNHVRND